MKVWKFWLNALLLLNILRCITIMGFLDTLKSWFTPAPTVDPVYLIHVRCRRCGEVIESRLNLQNDLSLQDDGTYAVHKTLMGNQRCFERLEVTLTFDNHRQLIERTVSRGEFVDPPTEL